MKTMKTGMFALAGAAALTAGFAFRTQPPAVAASSASTRAAAKNGKVTKISRTEAQWKRLLTPQQFEVLRQKGTEAPFSGDYHPRKEAGVYRCVACGLPLFNAATQFDSGTGWPSFYQPIAGHVENHADADGERTEVECARCGGHLGHVFDDGPQPTGLRYCMNAVALKFEKK